MSEAESVPARSRFGATLRRDAWWVELCGRPPARALRLYATARAFEGATSSGGLTLAFLLPAHRPGAPLVAVLARALIPSGRSVSARPLVLPEAYYRASSSDPLRARSGRRATAIAARRRFVLSSSRICTASSFISPSSFSCPGTTRSSRSDSTALRGRRGLARADPERRPPSLTRSPATPSGISSAARSTAFPASASGRARHRAWRWVTALNERHGLLAWLSLVSVALADLYVRSVACGAVADVRLL